MLMDLGLKMSGYRSVFRDFWRLGFGLWGGLLVRKFAGMVILLIVLLVQSLTFGHGQSVLFLIHKAVK